MRLKHTKGTGPTQPPKTSPIFVIKADEGSGIVEAIVSTFGVIDYGNDRIWPGAYAKTIVERAGQIRVLDHHNSSKIGDVLGRPMAMREVSRAELPPAVLKKFPSATGGLWTQTQYNMKTENGRDAFHHIVADDINEYSIGYDALDWDWETIDHPDKPGEKLRIRNLRTIRLWEYSPVIWGMNPATATVGAKGADGEDKSQSDAPGFQPYAEGSATTCQTCKFFSGSRRCDKYSFECSQDATCNSWNAREEASQDVDPESKEQPPEPHYRMSEEGGNKCETCRFFQGNERCDLHKFQARPDHVCDAWASPKSDDGPSEEAELGVEGPIQRLGDCLHAALIQTWTGCVTNLYSSGFLSTEEYQGLMASGMTRIDEIRGSMSDEMALRPTSFWYYMDMMSYAPEDEAKAAKAGRTLSGRNAAKITTAYHALGEVLTEAGIVENDEPPADQEAPAKSNDEPAGPPDQAPTDEMRKKQLLLRAQLIDNSST